MYDYLVVYSQYMDDLVTEVTAHLNNGYICVGGIAVWDTQYYQAMQRFNNPHVLEPSADQTLE